MCSFTHPIKKTIKYYKTFKLTLRGDMSLSPELSVVGSNRVCDPKIVALSLRVVRVHLYVSEVWATHNIYY